MLNAWPNTEVLRHNSHQLLSSSTYRCLRCLSRRHQRSSTSRSSSCAQCSSHSGERPTCISAVLRLADLLCHHGTKHGRCGNLGSTAPACCLAGRSQSCTRRALAKSEACASTLVYNTASRLVCGNNGSLPARGRWETEFTCQ
jgi:hypothetical protein